jgi:hypothetical protein
VIIPTIPGIANQIESVSDSRETVTTVKSEQLVSLSLDEILEPAGGFERSIRRKRIGHSAIELRRLISNEQ